LSIFVRPLIQSLNRSDSHSETSSNQAMQRTAPRPDA
jgi:hypothetical protein